MYLLACFILLFIYKINESFCSHVPIINQHFPISKFFLSIRAFHENSLHTLFHGIEMVHSIVNDSSTSHVMLLMCSKKAIHYMSKMLIKEVVFTTVVVSLESGDKYNVESICLHLFQHFYTPLCWNRMVVQVLLPPEIKRVFNKEYSVISVIVRQVIFNISIIDTTVLMRII